MWPWHLLLLAIVLGTWYVLTETAVLSPFFFGEPLSVAVLEKAREAGAHVLSGAVLDPSTLRDLVPDFEAKGAPLATPVRHDRVYFLTATGSDLEAHRAAGRASDDLDARLEELTRREAHRESALLADKIQAHLLKTSAQPLAAGPFQARSRGKLKTKHVGPSGQSSR